MLLLFQLLAGCEIAAETPVFVRVSSDGGEAAGGAGAQSPAPLRLLDRGFVATDWIETTYHRGYLTAGELTALQASGIRSVRIPFGMDSYAKPSALLFQEATPETLNPEALANYDEILDEVLGAGLAVVVTPADSDARTWLDAGYAAKLVQFWRAFSEHLAAREHQKVFIKVAYDPTSSDPEAWYGVQRQLLAAVRSANPDCTLLVTPNAYTRLGDRDPLRSLTEMTPLDDPQVSYDFGFFMPITFTLQGASWREPWLEPLHDLPYPATPEACSLALADIEDAAALKYAQAYCDAGYDRTLLTNAVQAVSDWATAHGVNVSNSGFGVYRPHVAQESRLSWLTDVRLSFEAAAIPWAFYNDAPDFSGLAGAAGEQAFEPGVAEALFAR